MNAIDSLDSLTSQEDQAVDYYVEIKENAAPSESRWRELVSYLLEIGGVQ